MIELTGQLSRNFKFIALGTPILVAPVVCPGIMVERAGASSVKAGTSSAK